MHIAFRVDASIEIGTGHVMRCLTLADVLKENGANCSFYARAHDGNLNDIIAKRGHNLVSLTNPNIAKKISESEALQHAKWLGVDWQTDASETLKHLHNQSVDWLIIDHYGIDYRWEKMLRKAIKKIMVIDDLADRKHECDVILDQNWFGDNTNQRYQGLLTKDCQCFLGPQYALLQPAYTKFRSAKTEFNGVVQRILVFMGGSDPTNESAKVIKALKKSVFKDIFLDVVIGQNHPDPKGIANLVKLRPNTILHHSIPSLAPLMAEADLMISAGGSTTWERMCLGLPAIVISIAINQRATNEALMHAGYITYLGEMRQVTSTNIAKAVNNYLIQPQVLQRQSHLAQELVPGSGANTICQALLKK